MPYLNSQKIKGIAVMMTQIPATIIPQKEQNLAKITLIKIISNISKNKTCHQGGLVSSPYCNKELIALI